jgi:hypothetical protein
VLVGSYALSQIDVDDVGKFGTGKGVSAAGALGHVEISAKVYHPFVAKYTT